MRPPPTPVAGARMSSTSAARVSSPQKPAAASTSARASSGPGPSTPPRIVSRSSAASAAGSPPTVSRRPSAITAPQTTAATGVARPPSAAGNIFKRPPSVAESTASTSAAARAPTPSTANHPHHADRAVSPVRQVSSPLQDLGSGKGDVRPGQTRSLSSVLSPTLPPVTSPREAVSQLPASRPASPDKDTAVAAFAHKRELEELRIKVRILESRKAEDQERIKSLESKVGEADALRAARVKLQGESFGSMPAKMHVALMLMNSSKPNFRNCNHRLFLRSARREISSRRTLTWRHERRRRWTNLKWRRWTGRSPRRKQKRPRPSWPS